MADFLFSLGQVLSILGLLYGAYLCITHRHEDSSPNDKTEPARFDPVTTHTWETPRDALADWLRRVS